LIIGRQPFERCVFLVTCRYMIYISAI